MNMSFGLNRAEVIGHLGADVTVNHLVSGAHVANLSIATDESYIDKASQCQYRSKSYQKCRSKSYQLGHEVTSRSYGRCSSVFLLGRPRFLGGGGGDREALVRTCSGTNSA